MERIRQAAKEVQAFTGEPMTMILVTPGMYRALGFTGPPVNSESDPSGCVADYGDLVVNPYPSLAEGQVLIMSPEAGMKLLEESNGSNNED